MSWELDDQQGPEAPNSHPHPGWKGLANRQPIISTRRSGRRRETGGNRLSHRWFSCSGLVKPNTPGWRLVGRSSIWWGGGEGERDGEGGSYTKWLPWSPLNLSFHDSMIGAEKPNFAQASTWRRFHWLVKKRSINNSGPPGPWLWIGTLHFSLSLSTFPSIRYRTDTQEYYVTNINAFAEDYLMTRKGNAGHRKSKFHCYWNDRMKKDWKGVSGVNGGGQIINNIFSIFLFEFLKLFTN